MKFRLISGKNRKRGVSSIIGAVILFGMLFTVAFGYFYAITQDQQTLQVYSRQYNNYVAALSQERLIVTGTLITNTLGFNVSNSGISATIAAYFIIDQLTGQIVQYKNSTSSPASNPALPVALNQGQSQTFNTGIAYVTGKAYTIKVLTARGTTLIGSYPNGILTSTAVNSLVAVGLGSLEMFFSSFKFYDYVSGPTSGLCAGGVSCSGGTWKIDINHPASGSLTPLHPNPVAFSIQILNADPSAATILIDSHTNLWTYHPCNSGCGGQAPPAFFVFEVASNGTITSTAQGSFKPILVLPQANITLYFGSINDLSLGAYGSQDLRTTTSSTQLPGEFVASILISGTKITTNSASLTDQNIPFSSTYAVDNLASFSETPVACTSGSTHTFTATVDNSIFSAAGINKFVVNASQFSSISASIPAPVAGWSASVSSGVITYTGGVAIGAGGTKTFSWQGTAPTVTGGSQVIFPGTIYWSSGQVTTQAMAFGCFVS